MDACACVCVCWLSGCRGVCVCVVCCAGWQGCARVVSFWLLEGGARSSSRRGGAVDFAPAPRHLFRNNTPTRPIVNSRQTHTDARPRRRTSNPPSPPSKPSSQPRAHTHARDDPPPPRPPPRSPLQRPRPVAVRVKDPTGPSQRFRRRYVAPRQTTGGSKCNEWGARATLLPLCPLSPFATSAPPERKRRARPQGPSRSRGALRLGPRDAPARAGKPPDETCPPAPLICPHKG